MVTLLHHVHLLLLSLNLPLPLLQLPLQVLHLDEQFVLELSVTNSCYLTTNSTEGQDKESL